RQRRDRGLADAPCPSANAPILPSTLSRHPSLRDACRRPAPACHPAPDTWPGALPAIASIVLAVPCIRHWDRAWPSSAPPRPSFVLPLLPYLLSCTFGIRRVFPPVLSTLAASSDRACPCSSPFDPTRGRVL